MSVYRCDYVVYGVKLPWVKEERKDLSTEGNPACPYWDVGVGDYHLIIDDMGGRYMVFGYVMYSKDYYANRAEDTFMEFDPVKTNSRRKDLEHHYFQAFGKNLEIEPETFAFSHIY